MLRNLFRQSLRWRIAILFSGLILILFTSALLIVNRENIRNAETNIESDLRVTVEVFKRLVENRTQSLQDIARPATSDGSPLLWPWLLERASRAKQSDLLEASGAVLINDSPHQVIVAPLLIPAPEAWIILGFSIDDSFAGEIAQIALTQISVYSGAETETHQTLYASSLDRSIKNLLFENINLDESTLGQLQKYSSNGGNYLSLNIELGKTPNSQIGVVIHGLLDQELEPYEKLNLALLIIFSAGLAFSFIGTLALSKSVTKPISELNRSVAAIGKGNYSTKASDSREDEIGELAKAVNMMAVGLE